MKTSRCFSRWFSVLVFSAIVGALLLGLGAGAQAKVSLPPKRGVSPAQGLDPGQDQALQYEVGHYWAGQDLLSYAHRDNALRFYYQNPHTKRIEQEVTEDVQTFLAYAAEKRQIAFNRDGNDEEFLRDAEEALIDADISDEQGGMRYGKAEITIVDKKYVVRYVHQESGLAFIILRPSQNPQPGKTPLWPQGNTVEELARSHSSASLNANWLADGAILGPEQAVDLKSRHLRQVLANQVMESDRAKGRHAILVLLSAQGEDLPLFMPGQVLPQYMPPRLFSKAYWKCYRYATLFAPDAGYWPFALFLAAYQGVMMLGIDALRILHETGTIDRLDFNYDVAKVTFVYGFVIALFYKTYKTWLNRGDSHVKKFFRNLQTKVSFNALLLALGYGGEGDSMASIFRRLGFNAVAGNMLKVNLLEKPNQLRNNRVNTHTLGEEIQRHPRLRQIYHLPGLQQVIDKLQIMGIKMSTLSYEWYYNFYFILKMLDLDDIKVNAGTLAGMNLGEWNIGHLMMVAAILVVQRYNQNYFGQKYAQRRQEITAYQGQENFSPSELFKMEKRAARELKAAQNAYQRWKFTKKSFTTSTTLLQWIWSGVLPGLAFLVERAARAAEFLALASHQQPAAVRQSFATWAQEFRSVAEDMRGYAAALEQDLQETSAEGFAEFIQAQIQEAAPKSSFTKPLKIRPELRQKYEIFLKSTRMMDMGPEMRNYLAAMENKLKAVGEDFSSLGQKLKRWEAAGKLWQEELLNDEDRRYFRAIWAAMGGPAEGPQLTTHPRQPIMIRQASNRPTRQAATATTSLKSSCQDLLIP